MKGLTSWRVGFSRELGIEVYSDKHEPSIYYFCRPRFSRTDYGWWLAPLLRIGYGKDSVLDAGVIEIPWIEKVNGNIRVKLVDRS